MHILKTFVTGAAAAAVLFTPITASAASPREAEQIRKLDIMLMVTSLRCRMGSDDFQPHYRKFSAKHLSTLNGAAKTLEGGLVKRHGAKGAKRALDRISVGMANQYGQGHPWLECAQLKSITHNLSLSKDPADLTIAADELLAASPVSGGRFASR
ncbi:S-adenosyl-L-homocysteine hydrolase [Qipengyuania sp. XHP0207]|uniref:S-adenosyl-L-homocysteine hydrolase n=1 Tax=Qipengyuania sp. XHP0207 TaxID=3038078 RepID=UPI0024203812|nr:S-adenosyl-L-homocysteine hydrolase [Qipengyuania sp. XHP0207]MDG5748575.1 S-adenosyl-L-homocysteine hydrolase [Qipengyuania sp. XHP0207]